MRTLSALCCLLMLAAFSPTAHASTPAKAKRGTRASAHLTVPVASHAATLTDVPEIEPNDSRATTQLISCGDRVQPASLAAPNDSDFFAITIPPGQAITVWTMPLSADPNALWGVDVRLVLLDADGNVVVEDDDSGPGWQPLFSYVSVTGGDYVLVSAGYDEFVVGDYALSVTCGPPSPPSNDQCAGAAPIECGAIAISSSTLQASADQIVSGICLEPSEPLGPDVVYRLQVNTGDVLALSATSWADVVLYLLDDCGSPASTCIAVSEMDEFGTQWLNHTFASAGVYHLVVNSFFTPSGTSFEISGSLTCQVVPATKRTWGSLKSIYR